MTNFLRQSMEETLQVTHYNLRELAPIESQQFRKRVADKYTSGKTHPSLFWELVAGYGGFSICDSDAWQWLDEFIKERKFILFFEESNDPTVYIAAAKQKFQEFLEEFPDYIFYVTNESLDYLIYFNDSDYLRCIGSAEPWLRQKVKQLSQNSWKDIDGRSFLDGV
ncbi:MAG: hypothetical protein AAF518_18650 [Spirochaetota bacterium]